MNIHEYQAKKILREFGVATLNGQLITSSDEVFVATQKLGGQKWVVKAQVHAGGRGKGGGVKLASSVKEVQEHVTNMIGMNLVTHQTGAAGKKVRKVWIEEVCPIAKEYYLAALVDRGAGQVTIMASSEGGMEIEEVAVKTPNRIFRVSVDPVTGLAPFQARQLAFALNLKGKIANQFLKIVQGLFTTFMSKDFSLIEINPLVVTQNDQVIALDAKMVFDSNALYRHPDVVELRDLDEEEPTEIEASKHDLAFIKLDGNIGCLVNGAGLAMATMDTIQLYGGNPANFLDVGGGANQEKVTAAFKIILKDPHVKGIFINIFGGIMKCDIIADGVIAATKELGLKVPLVVRLEGTNVEMGKSKLSQSGLNIITADGLADGAQKIVSAVK